MAKVLCPAHNDSTPSLHIYEEYAFCHVCGYRVKNSELGIEGVKYAKTIEDIKTSLEYISTLPIVRLRGLEFCSDSKGFYIVWPSKDYYKLRLFYGEQRYSGPKGVRPPLFIYPKKQKEHLVVIEGEINAMTINKYYNGSETICSPGGATNFLKFIKEFLYYKKITLILDNDPAGIVYGVETKELLLKAGKHVNLSLVATDYNDLLQRHDAEIVVEQFKKDIKS